MVVLGPDGIALEDGSFDSLIRPKKQVSTFIASLTGITNAMIDRASDWGIALGVGVLCSEKRQGHSVDNVHTIAHREF
jgi:hypothetical protein